MKVGTLTIGQSPRTDVIPGIRNVLGPNIEIVEKGALDGLDLEDVKKFYPGPNDYILVTRMRDGTEVKIAEKHVIDRMRRCISDFQGEPVEISILICTGEFPEIESKKILLRPDRIMLNVVQSLLDAGRLGVIVPSPDQIPALKRRWEKTHLEVVAEAVSPYTATYEELKEKANNIKRADVDFVVLDCIGFSQETRALFRQITEKPVLLPVTLMGRIAREMVGA
ncbi:AroM family protein [bacterium]|nr:AroM family protein [bacterium]